MARKPVWPPIPKPHASGKDRVRWLGRDYYVARGDAAEYAALLARLAEEDASPKAAARVTVAEAVLRFAEGKLPSVPAKQRWRYERALGLLVRTCGAEPADAFGAGALDRVRTAALDEQASPQYANALVSCIKTCWRWLELRGVIPEGRWGALRALRSLPVPRRKRRPWTDADAIRVALAMPRSPARLILLVQLWCGCRSGEAVGMRWDEIDTSGEVWTWCPSRHKCAWRGHERRILLGPRAQAVLAMARRRWPRSRTVFPALTVGAYSRAITLAARRAGVPGFHSYAARHLARTRVTRLAGIEAARLILGHSHLSQTVAYGVQDDATARDAARKAG